MSPMRSLLQWCAAAALVAGVMAAIPMGLALAQDMSDEARQASARAAALDPAEYQYVQPVCTACHSAQNFLHSRTWPEWQRTFSRMQENGARATPEQWGHIYAYFRTNLTLLYPNRAEIEELSDVLGVDEKTAIEIFRRHYDKPFDSAADLESVAGVNKERVEKLKDRLLFDLPRQGR